MFIKSFKSLSANEADDFKINLQLFAGAPVDEEEEIDDDGYSGSEDEDEDEDQDPERDDDEDLDGGSGEDDDDPDQDPDNPDNDSDEDDDPEDKQKGKKKPDTKKSEQKPDKVTLALIEQKRKNKELERRLKEIADASAAANQKAADDKRIADMVADGYGEAQARAIVANDNKTAKLERDMEKLKLEKLERRCPGISEHADEILDMVVKANGAFTAEEIYNAKFRHSSEYDTRTKAEAETLHRQKAAQQKKGTGSNGSSENKKPVKLSASDERAYQHLIKQRNFRNLTRAQYAKSVKGGEIDKD